MVLIILCKQCSLWMGAVGSACKISLHHCCQASLIDIESNFQSKYYILASSTNKVVYTGK